MSESNPKWSYIDYQASNSMLRRARTEAGLQHTMKQIVLSTVIYYVP